MNEQKPKYKIGEKVLATWAGGHTTKHIISEIEKTELGFWYSWKDACDGFGSGLHEHHLSKLVSDDKEVLELNYIGTDDWDRPVYKDQYEKLWKDIELGDRETPSLYTSTGNDFDGEPDCPINKEFVILTKYIKNNKRFEYMMLSRLKSDCDYYLGYGNRSNNALWAKDEKEQIEEMKKLYNSFEEHEKPEWLTWEQILDYEKRMLQTI